MTLFQRGRFWYWIARDLAAKYTRALGFGLLLGTLIAIAASLFAPKIHQQFFFPMERYGIVGEFTPTNLPLSIQKLISHGLTEVNEDGSIVPSLARSWEATDSGKIYNFTLNNSYVWHTGKPVVASDINYNIKDVRITALDDVTLRVELTTPFAPLPTLVSKPIFQKGLQGFGPYRVATIQLKGDTVQLLKLESLSTSKLPTREYRFYRTEALAALAFRLGILEDLSSTYGFEEWKTVTVTPHQKYNRIVTLFFRMSEPMLRDKNIRQALGYALPEIEWDRAVSPVSKTSWAYTDDVRDFSSDPATVKRLLQNTTISTASGELTITTFSQYLDLAQKIAERWRTFGIPASVRVENVVPPDYKVLLTAQDLPPDPDQYPLWHSTQQESNITGYANVKIDKLLEDGRVELDVGKRKKIYEDFQRRLVDDAPALFLYYPTSFTIRRGLE